MAPQREWFEKDYYKVARRARRRLAEGHHQGVPQAGAPEPPRRQPGRPDGRGALQGDLRGLRRASATRPSARSTTRSASWARWARRSAAGRAGPGAGLVHVRRRRRPRRPPRQPVRPRGPRRRRRGRPGRRAAAGRGPRGRAAPVVRRRRATASPRRCTSRRTRRARRATARAPSPGTRRTCARSAAAAASSTTTRASSRSPRRAPRATARASSSTTRARPAAAPASSAGPREVKVRIPAGVADGQRIRLKGRGAPGPQRRPARRPLRGVQRRARTPVFGRDGDDLTLRVPVTFPEAVLGADIQVPTLDDGKVRIRLKPGTQPGSKHRVKGRGIATKKHTGDLIVVRRRGRAPASRPTPSGRRSSRCARPTTASPRAYLEEAV